MDFEDKKSSNNQKNNLIGRSTNPPKASPKTAPGSGQNADSNNRIEELRKKFEETFGKPEAKWADDKSDA